MIKYEISTMPILLHKYMQLWGKTEQLHMQNMEQLHGYDLRNVQMFVQGQKPLGKRLVNKKNVIDSYKKVGE